MRILLTKAAAIRAFGGVQRRLALALGISAQAVNKWGRNVPELTARKLLELKPELHKAVRYAKDGRRA